MAEPYIPTWGFKDPDDVRPKRFDAAGQLSLLGNPAVTLAEVFVGTVKNALGEIVADDGALVISQVIYDPTTKFVTFVWAGGTLGFTYLITCRLHLQPGWQIDQSATVTIGQK